MPRIHSFIRKIPLNSFEKNGTLRELEPHGQFSKWLKDHDVLVYRLDGEIKAMKLLQARFLVRKFSQEFPGRDSAILDIGCGGGHLLMQLRRQGYENLTALDLDERLRATLEAQGIKFISGDIESELEISSYFDALILNNVIEHLADPVKVIGRLKALMKPNGCILVVTPNERSLSRHLFGRNWAGLHAPRHVHIFNPDSLTEMARGMGF